jgi:hypothetical protein
MLGGLMAGRAIIHILNDRKVIKVSAAKKKASILTHFKFSPFRQ